MDFLGQVLWGRVVRNIRIVIQGRVVVMKDLGNLSGMGLGNATSIIKMGNCLANNVCGLFALS